MELVNLTGKKLQVAVRGQDTYLELPGSTLHARPFVPITYEHVAYVDGVEITRTIKGDVTNLPPKKDGVLYIVTKMTAEVAKRDDFVVAEQTIKNSTGGIIACRSFSKI